MIYYIRRVKRLTLITVILTGVLILSIPAAAGDGKGRDPQYVFYKGNTLYEEGKYDEAIKVYSQLIEQGLESGHLHYNIGNSYFKKGELGMAILYYERAKRLMPGDSDLRANHQLALTKVRQASFQASTPWYKRALSVFSGLTINGITVLLSIIYVMILLSLLCARFIPHTKKYSYVTAALLLVLLLAGALSLYDSISLIDSEAVIIAEDSEAKFEPLEKATTHFTLYEGMKVRVLQSRKEWLKVKRSDNKTGWIKKAEAELI